MGETRGHQVYQPHNTPTTPGYFPDLPNKKIEEANKFSNWAKITRLVGE